MNKLLLILALLFTSDTFACIDAEKITNADVGLLAKSEVGKIGFHALGVKLEGSTFYGTNNISGEVHSCVMKRTGIGSLIIHSLDRFCSQHIEGIKNYVSKYNEEVLTLVARKYSCLN